MARNQNQAVLHLQTAIRLAASDGFVRLLADAEMTLADIYAKQGKLKLAENMAQRAISATRNNAEPYLLPQRLTSLAALQVREGRYSAAERSYDQAGYSLHSMLGHVSSVAAKTSLIATMTDLYVGEFGLLVDNLHQPDKAFLALEDARGRILRELLLEGQRTPSAQQEKVERRIAGLRLRLAATSSQSRAKSLRDQIFLAEQSRSLLTSSVKWPAEQIHPLSSTEVRNRIQPDEVVLEYVLGDARSYCLALTNQLLKVVALPGRAGIETDIEAYVTAIQNHTTGASAAKKLYSDLLGSIPGLDKHRNLVVVPDGKLFLVPFDALMNASGEYLVNTHTVSYTPSANTFVLMRSLQTASQVPDSLLAVGGVPYKGQQRQTRGLLRSGKGVSLGDLPGSKEEVKIASSVDQSDRKTILTGLAATETAVKNADLEHRSIIHLAVHGVADTTHPDRAALVLLSDSTADQDGLLQASEISNMRLKAEVVVLSACDTAAGRLQGEAGIANLAGAFLLAGAHSVVSTLWSTDDTFSVFFMKQFYEHLKDGNTVGESLASSKRDVLRTFGSRAVPYFWAGYTVEGVSDQRIKTNEHKLYASY